MAIKFIVGTEDVPKLVNLPFDQEDSWWGGVYQCGVSVALGVALAASSFSATQARTVANSPQDEIIGLNVDETYWQNPVAPIPSTLGSLYLPDPEELPGNLVNLQVDEAYWQNPVPPVQASLYQPLALVDPDFAPPTVAAFQLDEDFWVQPPPVQSSFYQKLPLGDVEEIPGSLYIPLDEDFWVNPVAPIQASFSPLPFQIEPDFATVISLDEDFWQNPVFSVQATLYQTQPYGFDEGLWTAPPAPLSPDEDFWINPVAPVQLTMYQALPIGDGSSNDFLVPPVVTTRPNSIRAGIDNL